MPGEENEEIRLELTDDEAIAWALKLCPDGESIEIHDPECAVEADHPERCNCIPQVLRKGAYA